MLITVNRLLNRGTGKSVTATLTSTGNGTGVSTLRLETTQTQTLTLTGSARFYTDAAGTLGESTTWTVTAGALRTIYVKAPSGVSSLLIPTANKIIRIGSSVNDGWISSTNAASLSINISKFNLISIRISGTSEIIGVLPTGLTTLYLSGSLINWTYTGSLPTGLTNIYLSGSLINWTYTGALPTGLTYLLLSGNLINWTYSGALPTGLTFLYLSGNLINWTYSGALPTGLTNIYLSGNLINWTYSGALPTGLTFLQLFGIQINWTGLDVGNNGNIGTFSLLNYRISKMNSTDMVTLLTQLTNRTGSLPNTLTINDYADYASPPASVTNAIAALKVAKPNITTVTLGA